MSVSEESAIAFAQGLRAWGEALPSDQQQVLQALMEFAVIRVEGALQGVNADASDPDANILEGARAAISDFARDANGVRPQTTPCWTTTTVTTTAQTSKWFCSKKK